MLNNLIKLRKQHNLTQKDVAKMLGVATSTYSYWETSKNEPDINSLKILAKYFNVTIDYLLDISKEPSGEEERTCTVVISNADKERHEYRLTAESGEIIMQITRHMAK